MLPMLQTSSFFHLSKNRLSVAGCQLSEEAAGAIEDPTTSNRQLKPSSKVVLARLQQRLRLDLGQRVDQRQPRRPRIGHQRFVQQLVVQGLVEHQARVELRVQHTYHLVLAGGQFKRLVEIRLALLGLATQRRRADRVDYAEVQVGSAV